MSEQRGLPHSMDSTEHETELPRSLLTAEEEDVYAQLAQKERDLILAAELGKALLDSNQELQSRYDQAVDEYTHKIEELQQEKYGLHLELEKLETEYQNNIKDLQEDIATLRKQARASDELQESERVRSRSLREAQQNSDYLLEQVKKASLREEELMKELDQQKMKNESSCATIQDQIDHITMLRDQIEYLSSQLRESTKKIENLQREKEILMGTLETTQENMQVLEDKISQQEDKIHRQASDIEELQESNSDLLQQLQQRHSAQFHHPYQLKAPYLGARTNSSTKHNISGNRQNLHNLYFELNQEKQKQSQSHPNSLVHQPITHQPKIDTVSEEEPAAGGSRQSNQCVEADHSGGPAQTSEQSLFAELSLGDRTVPQSSSYLLTDFTSMCRHNRHTGDCSICCLMEGSRKRHHQNINGGSDDEEGSDSGPKQSVYSESRHSLYDPSRCSAISILGSQNSSAVSLQFDAHGQYKIGACEQSSVPEFDQKESTHPVFPNTLPLSESETFSKSCLPDNSSLNSSPKSEVPSDHDLLSLDVSSSSEDSIEKSLFSELPAYIHEFCPIQQEIQEQSLFSELSSQLYDDKNGTGSDSSSNCILGAFDFHSGCDGQDMDRNSNESLNRSMEIKSRIESDMSCVSDWYYMTPVTSEMLEDDDFECDDDDFLVGNMAGTTLSISDNSHGLNYHYHGYSHGETLTYQECDTQAGGESFSAREVEGKGYDKQQAQLSEACRQLQELVIRVGGESSSPESQTLQSGKDIWEANTDMLLSLVAEMRVCIDRITAHETQVVQSSDISTTVRLEATTIDSTSDMEHGQSPARTTEELRHLQVADKHIPSLNKPATKAETHKQIRKSKSSSSLV